MDRSDRTTTSRRRAAILRTATLVSFAFTAGRAQARVRGQAPVAPATSAAPLGSSSGLGGSEVSKSGAALTIISTLPNTGTLTSTTGGTTGSVRTLSSGAFNNLTPDPALYGSATFTPSYPVETNALTIQGTTPPGDVLTFMPGTSSAGTLQFSSSGAVTVIRSGAGTLLVSGASWLANSILMEAADGDTARILVPMQPGYELGLDVSRLSARPPGALPVAGDARLVRTTIGDATLDGRVDGDDLERLADHFNGHTAAAASRATSWSRGDFNYDHRVDVGDLALTTAAYGAQLVPTSVALPPVTLTPEPTAVVSLAGLTGAAALRRRQR